MTLNAKSETIAAVTEALKLASFLDDRIGNPDRYRLAAWSEQAQRHKLTEGDLLDGVQAFHDQSSDRAMQCGDLIHHARAAKRARLEAALAERVADRERVGDRKAADDTASVAAAFVGGKVKHRTERLDAAEKALQFVYGRDESVAAIREFFAAKAEAQKLGVAS